MEEPVFSSVVTGKGGHSLEKGKKQSGLLSLKSDRSNAEYYCCELIMALKIIVTVQLCVFHVVSVEFFGPVMSQSQAVAQCLGSVISSVRC